MSREVEIVSVEHDERALLESNIDGGFLHLGVVGGSEVDHG